MNKEKGSKIIKPDDGGDEMFCHVRDVKDGESEVSMEGNTAKRKVSYDGMLATSLTQTAKQSFEPQARSSTLRDDDIKELVSASNRAGALFSTSPMATPRHCVETESLIPRGVAEEERRGKLGMDSAREVLASRGVGHETTQRRRSGTSRCDFLEVGQTSKQVKSHTAVDA